MIFIKILAFILLLGIIVFIHEFGHFITAKLFKVKVHEFSLGMGPSIFKKQGKETIYSLRLLPIGGYVSMAGEDVNSNIEKDKGVSEDRKYYNLPYFKKIIILAAGVIMNFILAISIFSIIALHNGYAEELDSTITSIVEESPAEDAGLLAGDKIIKITKEDGSSMDISSFYDIQVFTYDVTDKDALTYSVNRDGEILDFTLSPKDLKNDGQYYIGIQAENKNVVDVKWYNSPYYGVRYFSDTIKQTFTGLRMLFKPGGIKMMSGPIGIAAVTGEAVSNGILSYLYLIALVSTSIGIFNLLPLPILDGGQIVIETVQKLLKRKMGDKLKFAINLSCWILILILFITVFYNDFNTFLLK